MPVAIRPLALNRAYATKTAAGDIPRGGLIAEYLFDEGTGQRVYDHSGNGNQGVLGATSAASASDPTRIMAGLLFPSGSSVYTTHGAISYGGATQNLYTFILLFRPLIAITSAATNRAICNFRTSDATNFAGVMTGSYTGTLSDEVITLVNRVGDTTYRTAWLDASVTIDTNWHGLILVWNGSNYDIYFDLVKNPATAGTSHSPLISLDNFRIGAMDASGSPFYFSVMEVASCHLYNRSLTSTDLNTFTDVMKEYLKPRGIVFPYL
jgi:hypothetical protein